MRTNRHTSHGPRIKDLIPRAAAMIPARSHLPELSVALLTALSVSSWDCWSKFTIRRYQKTRMLFIRAAQLRSVRPASAASPLSRDAASSAATASGSSLSQALF